MTSDADLVRRCLEGDRVAWTSILSRYADLAYALLRRAGLDDATAEDAFQEVALLLWKNLKKLRDVERLASWIGTTTRRVAWRLRKRGRTREGHETAAARDDDAPGAAPDEAAARVEEEQSLREALSALGERCRELLSLLYFQPVDLTYDEIAHRLGVPRGSLGPTRQRCLDALREDLTARGVTGEAAPGPAPSVSVPGMPASAVVTPGRGATKAPSGSRSKRPRSEPRP
ncbi:MAG: sigma-70 family RNA polymerase sigma factor [Planctomycetia bacterium]|nr:sigma-70 family RNA polymerase sigma factor [Planctomycetia bacterium]